MSERNWALGAVFVLLTPADLGLGLYVAIQVIRYSKQGAAWIPLVESLRLEMTVWASLTALLDSVICGVLIFNLRRARTGLATTADAIVKRVCQLALSTSAVITVVAIVIAALNIVKTPKALYYSAYGLSSSLTHAAMIPANVFGPIGGFSVLYTINNRAALQSQWLEGRPTVGSIREVLALEADSKANDGEAVPPAATTLSRVNHRVRPDCDDRE